MKILKIGSVLCAIFATIMFICVAASTQEDIFWIYFLLYIYAVAGSIALGVLSGMLSRKRERQTKITSGHWDFPCRDFYIICNQNGIKGLKSFSDPTNLKRAKLIVEDLLTEEKIPASYIPIYCTQDKLISYYEQGKQLHAEEKRQEKEDALRQKQLELIRKNTPIDAALSDQQKNHQNLIDQLVNYSGTNKRKFYVNLLLDKLRNEVAEQEKFVSLLDDLSSPFMYAANLQQNLDVDKVGNAAWSYGGSGAEQMARFQAQQANQIIDARNEQIMKSARAQADQVKPAARQAQDKLYVLEQQYNQLNQKASEKNYQYKLDFDIASTKDLYPLLTLSGKIEKEENALMIKATVSSQDSNLFESINDAVIDGMLTANVYCRNILVDKVYMALPIDGISHNDNAQTICSYARKIMPTETEKYTVEFEPLKLWIMER